VFKRKLFPAALGLWIGFSGGAGRGQEGPLAAPLPESVREPGRLVLAPGAAVAAPSQNQRMAEAIADHLQRSGRLRGYRVDIRCADGNVELSGRVADTAQRTEVLRLVQALPGVERISDLLDVAAGSMVLATQVPTPEQEGAAEKAPLHPPVAGDDQGPFAPVRGLKRLTTDIPQEPMSIMEGPNPGGGDPTSQPPPMPPYAWPTYAPYNNYSRVGYPTLYPYQAFPFIGPMYPFPKIPLGWRAVTLQWQDGYWWYGRKATGHDWWRVRYY
jgi:hypothetical protein